jgi:NTE family protein
MPVQGEPAGQPPSRGVDTAPGERRPVVGLALGGGAALGAAHVGVLEVLEDAGVDVRVVVGTSAGALIGAAYASGMRITTLARIVRSAAWGSFGKLTIPRQLGVLDTTAFEATINELSRNQLIEDLPRRFAAVATDVRTLAPSMLDSGPLPSALLASIAVPGLFPPVRIGDSLLIDGAFSSNVPTWAARLLGAERVITVRLKPERVMRPMALLRQAIGGFDDYPTDILLSPDTTKFSRWSANDVPSLIESGRQAAEAALEQIAALASQPTTAAERETAKSIRESGSADVAAAADPSP